MAGFPNLVRPQRLAILLIVVVAVAGGLWLWSRAGSSTPASEDAALQDFREGRPEGRTAGGTPRPGVYAYRVSGSEKGGLGPLGVGRDLPRRALYVVTAVPGGYREELRLSKEHVEATRFAVRPDGIREVWRRTQVTFVGVGRDDRRDISPAPLHVPRPLRVGREWTERYAAGDLTIVARNRVVARGTLPVAGGTVEVFVIRSASETSGSHPGTRTDTLWWAPSLALPVRWTIEQDIHGTVKFRVRARLDLESAEPRT